MQPILIVDDHPLFRSGLKGALESSGVFGDILEAGCASEAQAILGVVGGARLAAVILDINLPDGSGLDLLEHFGGGQGSPRFFMLSMQADRAVVLKAMLAGAQGYASKQIPLDALILGLRLVLADQIFIEAELLRDLLTPRQVKSMDAYRAQQLVEGLSTLEQEILQPLVSGTEAKDIAATMNISPRMLEIHRRNIMGKLGVTTPLALVRLAVQAGIIEL